MSQAANTPPPGGQSIPTPPPPPPPHAGPTTSTLLRNILVSVISTVLGASIIYFLGFHGKGKGGDSFLERKEATTSAWKSYIAFENAYAKNSLSYEKEMPARGLDYYMEGIIKESTKFQKDMAELAKRDGIDKDLVSVLSRRVENDKNVEPQLKEYFGNIKRISTDTATTAEDKVNALVNEETRWLTNYKSTFERAVNDIQEIAKTLTERYSQQFSMNDFVVIQQYDQRMKTADSSIAAFRKMATDYIDSVNKANEPKPLVFVNFKVSDIAGKWRLTLLPEQIITIQTDGKFSWVFNKDTRADGPYKIEKGRLIMTPVVPTGKKIVWAFRIANLSRDGFSMMPDGDGNVPYLLERVKD